MYMNIKNKKIIVLVAILLLSAFLRLYKLDQIPVSLNWDEVAAGYNAFTIGNWGRDEWGKFMPLVFTSFKDDKHPVHIYFSVPFIKIFGLSDFATRLSSAIVGILSVLAIYFLSFYLFKNFLTASLSALFLALSPYHIQFSRGLWESNFAMFFFILGLTCFYKAISGSGKFIMISFSSFGISLLAYHSAKVVVPPLVIFLVLLYFKELKKLSLYFYVGVAIFLIFISVLILNPRLAGIARVKQTQFSQSEIEKTQIFKTTNNYYLGLSEIMFNGWIKHFSVRYLFISGDQSPRNSVKVFGEFYMIDALFLAVGTITLILYRSKITIFILSWLLVAPIPASLVTGAPNANRALFVLGSMILISALGASSIIIFFRNRIKIFISSILIIILSFQVFSFIKYYFETFPKKDPYDWVYGMKEIVEYVKQNDDKYGQVFMTDIRSQPYIFFLYYLKFNVTDFTSRVVYNKEDSQSYNTVSYFEKYYFGGWDPIESFPNLGVLYIVSPSQYDGLRYKSQFDVKKIVNYPDGSLAFFIITSK